MHKQAKPDGTYLKTKKSFPTKFTNGTDPFERDVIKFVLGENTNCPSYLPMQAADVNMTLTTCHAAIHDDKIPISEYMKKEFFYRCY